MTEIEEKELYELTKKIYKLKKATIEDRKKYKKLLKKYLKERMKEQKNEPKI